jgi:hypothetical protein
MRVEKCRTIGDAAKLGAHHERGVDYKGGSNPNIDHGRTEDNYYLVDKRRDGSVFGRVDRRIKEGHTAKNKDGTPKVIRDDAVPALDVFFGFSSDDSTGLRPKGEKLTLYFEKCLEWAKNRFGEANIISAVVHLDEETPHMHLLAVPIVAKTNEKGVVLDSRLNAKALIGEMGSLRKMQDSFFENVSGTKEFNLKRGEKVEITKRKHIPTSQLKARTAKEVEELQEKKNILGNENYILESKNENLKEENSNLEGKAENQKREIYLTESKLKNLNKELEKLKKEIERVHDIKSSRDAIDTTQAMRSWIDEKVRPLLMNPKGWNKDKVEMPLKMAQDLAENLYLRLSWEVDLTLDHDRMKQRLEAAEKHSADFDRLKQDGEALRKKYDSIVNEFVGFEKWIGKTRTDYKQHLAHQERQKELSKPKPTGPTGMSLTD